MTTHNAQPISVDSISLPSRLRKSGIAIFAALGVLGIAATLLEMTRTGGLTKQVLYSYLVAFMFVTTICLGGLFFVLVQHVVAAKWSVTVRRIAESLASTLPILTLLFLPLAFGVYHLYDKWAGPEAQHHKAIIAKSAYLNVTFFLIRSFLYLAIWSILGMWVHRRSLALDKTEDPTILKNLRKGSAPALFLFGISIAFAGFDWMMSLEPEWYSTIFGVYVFAGSVVSALAILTLSTVFLQKAGLLQGIVTKEHYHDLGKLTFGFVVFWAYIYYSQIFLIWYANIPEETNPIGLRWFANEGKNFDPQQMGWWFYIFVALVACQFFIPFWILLSRYAKRATWTLSIAGIIILVGHYFDLYWFCMPGLHPQGFAFHWFDLTALLGTMGVVGSLFFYRLGKGALVPVGDPYLSDSMRFENV